MPFPRLRPASVRTAAASVLLTALLAACGGGDDPPPPAPPPAGAPAPAPSPAPSPAPAPTPAPEPPPAPPAPAPSPAPAPAPAPTPAPEPPPAPAPAPAPDTTPPALLSSELLASGTQIRLRYDETLNPAMPPTTASFTVRVDGSTVSLSTLTVSGPDVLLGLAVTVPCGLSVSFSYTDPTAGDDASAIQDLAGNDAASVSNRAVTNASTATGGTVTYLPNVGTTVGLSDASAALLLDDGFLLVGDDEANALRVYPRTGGAAVREWAFGAALGVSGEIDLEAAARVGSAVYVTGSHSNKKSGAADPNRSRVFLVDVSGTGATTSFTLLNQRSDFKLQLLSWDIHNVHGKGANHYGLHTSTVGLAPERVDGFSIEGLTTSPDDSQLWFAFRAPQVPLPQRGRALIVPVARASFFGAAPLSGTGTVPTLTFGAPIELKLGGRGIRDIVKIGAEYLIVAGPAGEATDDVTHDFRLYRWSGSASSDPVELANDLDSLRAVTRGSFESFVAAGTATGSCVLLIQDNGDTVWPGETQPSKDLAPASQRFQGRAILLGAAAPAAPAPQLRSSTPVAGTNTVAPNAPIVLRFDQGVQPGTGTLVLRRQSDNGVERSFDVTAPGSVGFAFNAVTLSVGTPLGTQTGYYLEAPAGAIRNHDGVGWAGLSGSTAFAFTTTAALTYTLIITEVNSNATGGDFFELYNYGSTRIDLAGWKWIDDAANFSAGTAVTFPAGSYIDPGERLVVVQSTGTGTMTTAWALPSTVRAVAHGGPGLGSGDAVVLFAPNAKVVAAMNYKNSDITASDGTVIVPARKSGGGSASGGHAGTSVGSSGNDKKSAVWDRDLDGIWDGAPYAKPRYKTAVAGELDAYAQTGDAASVGSPGQ